MFRYEIENTWIEQKEDERFIDWNRELIDDRFL